MQCLQNMDRYLIAGSSGIASSQGAGRFLGPAQLSPAIYIQPQLGLDSATGDNHYAHIFSPYTGKWLLYMYLT